MVREEVGEKSVVWTALEAAMSEGAEAAFGGAFEVTLIRPGVSKNGLRYGESVLAESVGLWEGAACFCDHPGPLDQGRAGGRSVRDLVGVYSAARYVAGRGVVATLRLYPNAGWLAALIEGKLADERENRPSPRLGVSADMTVIRSESGEKAEDGRRVYDVGRIVAVGSADVVMNPSAGGRFERRLEAILAANETARTKNGRNGKVGENLIQDIAGASRAELITLALEGVVESKLAGASLPEAARELARQQTRARLKEVFSIATEGVGEGEAISAARLVEVARGETDRAVEGVRNLLGQLGAPGVIGGAGARRQATRITLTGRERLEAALDRLFGLEVPDYLSDVPRLSGIREAYIAITGDRSFSGRYSGEESVLEANEVTSSVMSDVLADTLNKRLVRDYRAQARWWEPIVVKTALKDMRAQSRVLLSDFASLSTVSENGAYANVAWGDTKEVYTPGKRGNLVYVTLETIINDDLRAVTRIPQKLATSATITINEYMATLFTQNAGLGSVMSDTYNVFELAHHANYGATALGADSLESAMVTMAKQSNSASKRLGLMGRWLVVPADLMYDARVLTETDRLVGSASNDINPLVGRVLPVMAPGFTDANNWYLMADPSQIECLEIGFLNGREEPEILVQDSPTSGSVFTNDAITFKVRHIYGGGWLDYRGAFGAVVA